MKKETKILGASIGNCIHVIGINKFLKLAEEQGYKTIFLGSTVSIEDLVKAIIEKAPDIVAISYRLTPETAKKLFEELKTSITKKGLQEKKYIFGGTPPVAKVAKKTGIFDKVFDGTETMEDINSYLNQVSVKKKEMYPSTLLERIKQKYPYPLLRHHFGLPSLQETIDGAREIAEAKVLDILSLGPDQNAQEFFFRPDEMDHKQDGAGGMPLRNEEDLASIYKASRCGNFPLVRCYSGTNDVIKWAEMLVKTIDICFGAVPLFWYSQLDGRSSRNLLEAIKENQSAIQWYANRGIPVEINESHQWALRECGDTIEVATQFLAAYNAKKLGVKHFVSQYMFNTPPGTSPKMDIAKMLAKIELIEGLHDNSFTSYRMVRTGLASMDPDFDIAKGQMASSIQTTMAINPHIVHVVGYCEGDHAATPKEIVESCKIIDGVIKNSLLGLPDVTKDLEIKKRKDELIKEAKVLLNAISKIAKDDIEDPLIDPKTLTKAVKLGLLDASHLKGNKYSKGEINTRIIDGACSIVDGNGNIIPERKRLEKILS